MTHTWALDISPKLKSLQDLSIWVNPKVTKEVVHHAGPKDVGKLFIHSNPLKQVHIVYMSVTKLSLVERLILLHLLGATNRNVITVHGHRNVIVCKIVDRPASCDPSPEREL
jgi:hypothetical protein